VLFRLSPGVKDSIHSLFIQLNPIREKHPIILPFILLINIAHSYDLHCAHIPDSGCHKISQLLITRVITNLQRGRRGTMLQLAAPRRCGNTVRALWMQSRCHSQYSYDSLFTSTSIRLLELDPGEESDPLVCGLTTVNLEDAPHYEAISYVWGSPTIKVNITCGGKQLGITPNLRAVLQRVRLPSKKRKLWADAICINQEDLNERASQVRLMRRIFGDARRVLAWLGPADNDEVNGLDVVKEIAQLCCWGSPASMLGLKRFGSVETPVCISRLRHLPPPDSALWTPILHLLRSPYFSRTWIVPEASGHEEVLALYGNAEADIDVIATFVRFLMLAAERAPKLDKTIAQLDDSLNNIRLVRYDRINNLSMRRLLRETMSLGASDPRDKVYSMLEFARFRGEAISIVPNYRKPVSQVYQEAALAILEADASALMLSDICHLDEIEEEFPSWVPRWDRKRSTMRLSGTQSRFNASNGTKFAFKIKGNLLVVRGFRVDTIKLKGKNLKSEDLDISMDNAQGMIQMWHDLLQSNGEVKLYRTGENMTTALAMTLTAGIDTGFRALHAEYGSFLPNFAAYFLRLLEKLPSGSAAACRSLLGDDAFKLLQRRRVQGSWELYLSAARNTVNNRRLFTTMRDYIGLGPKALREEDQVWVLVGSKIPYVLRAKGQQYQFVGECYIHGVMNGEAILEKDADHLVEEAIELC
jgi:hypothetical protein